MDFERRRAVLGSQALRLVLAWVFVPALGGLVWLDDAGAAPSSAVSAAEASAHIGETATVEGHVDAVVCSGQACLLSFEQGFSGLVASIPVKSRSRFPDPRKTYLDQTVRIRGKIEERDGRPRLELTDPKKIEIVKQGVGIRSAREVEGAARSATMETTSVAAADAAPSAVGQPIVAKGLDGRTTVVSVTQQEPQSAEQGGGLASIRAALEQEEIGSGPPSAAIAPLPSGGMGAPAGAGSGHLDSGGANPGLDYGGGMEGTLPLVDDPTYGGAGYGGAVEEEITALRGEVAYLEQTLMELTARLSALESSGIAAPGEGASAATTGDAYAGASANGLLPSVPSYIVSETTSSTLRRVKRGWSSTQVLKVLGEPAQVAATAQGTQTWNYGQGRSITLDQRGRVMSSVGF